MFLYIAPVQHIHCLKKYHTGYATARHPNAVVNVCMVFARKHNRKIIRRIFFRIPLKASVGEEGTDGYGVKRAHPGLTPTFLDGSAAGTVGALIDTRRVGRSTALSIGNFTSCLQPSG